MKKVAVILNLNKQYDRSIVSGIARFAKELNEWSLHIEDEPQRKIPDFTSWNGDGIIADLDDMTVYETIIKQNIPIVGLGGGYLNTSEKIPYVYTDNKAIAELAAEHLYNCVFRNLAFCNILPSAMNGWAEERSEAFNKFAQINKCRISTFEQSQNEPREQVMQSLVQWLKNLPKPCGLMAANDSRARMVLEACRRANLKVPMDIAVVGVDDDPLMCELSSPPLSSVIQGTDQLGYEASKLLHQMMQGKAVSSKVISPGGLSIRQSSDIIAIDDPIISTALSFISQNACSGIRVDDVARKLEISRSNLEKRFKTSLDQTVHERINDFKIKKAKDLLIGTQLSINEIAFKTGFNTVQYMSKVIKDNCGKSPKEIRLKHSPR
ncbi:XylR family transcriptional regulator [Lentisphaera marina]|uniref:XylR family transcriptional regulator n=1 Tax=Lentisphaera marina TaxID=1111041 RepID=UPI002365AEAC|nr:XylR family transcriptional regulator [Lentisphaera marina]MDD7985260.1 XylR family transcriptional regulator [Lentisphaera marina]